MAQRCRLYSSNGKADPELFATDSELLHEFEVLRTLDHPHVIKVYECLEDKFHYYFILDY